MFINVTCCKKIAKKLFEHFLQSFTHDVPRIQVTAGYFGVCVIASTIHTTA